MRERLVAILMLSLLAAPAWAQADGKAVFDKTCASCHGADGKGNAAKEKMLKIAAGTTNLGRAESAALSRDERKKIVVEGKGKMPAYGKKLTPAEIDAAVEHAAALAGGGGAKPAEKVAPAAAPAPAVDAAKAASLWKKSCASCHGADGAGSAAKEKALKLAAGKTNLGRDEAKSFDRATIHKAIADGTGKMPAYAKKLSAAEVDLLTEYSMALAAKARAK